MRYGEKHLFDNHNNIVLTAFFSSLPACTREFRKHHHAECELSAFISGTGTYKTTDKTYKFSPGSVFVFSSNEVHCITEATTDCTILCLRFIPGLLVQDGGDMNLLKIFFSRNHKFENLLDVGNPASSLIHNKISDIEQELAHHKDGYNTMIRCDLLSIFVSLIRDFDYVDKSVPYDEYKGSIVSIGNALRFINENLDRPITLEEISDAAAMSPAYFSTVFKKINGLSPWRYITIKRVEKAVELLKTTELTKLDIAMQCGFNSSSNFYKAFFAVTGKRPKDYTKQK